MKLMRKLVLSLVLTLIAVCSMAVAAMGEDNTVEMTIGETTTGYADLAAAVNAIKANSDSVTATIKLLADQALGTTRLDSRYDKSKDSVRNLTFDLNGHKITYSGSSSGWIQISNATTMTVKNGTIDTGSKQFCGSAASGSKGSTINMVNLTWKTTGSAWQYGAQTIVVTSGVYNLDPTSYLGSGSTVVQDSTTKLYTVTAPTPAAKIGDEEYATYDAAIAAAVDGDTVTLLKDCEKTVKVTTIAADTEITLDLNGYNLTNTYTGSTGTNARYFYVKAGGTLNIKDSEGGGSITPNAECTSSGPLAFAQGTAEASATINILSGYFYGSSLFSRSAPATDEATGDITNKGGVVEIKGGWFEKEQGSNYIPEGYDYITVSDCPEVGEDGDAVAFPITVTNTCKTVVYQKNNASVTGENPDTAYKYYLEGKTVVGYPTYKLATQSYTIPATLRFVGWSTDSAAMEGDEGILQPGASIDISSYSASTTFYAIWATVSYEDWVCVDASDTGKGYADLNTALGNVTTGVVLIKDITDRVTIAQGSGKTINLNGYNIDTTCNTETGSAITIKEGVTISIKNEAVATFTLPDERNISTGTSGGIIKGIATNAGGGIESNGANTVVKIYEGVTVQGSVDMTETGSTKRATVLTCASGGSFVIYGGTFAPLDSAPEGLSAFYAGTGAITIAADSSDQSAVRMNGTFETYSETKGTIQIAGGWFSNIPERAAYGTWDAANDVFTSDEALSLIGTTGDATYPYQVGSIWNISYELNGGENNAANPAYVDKSDSTVITLGSAVKTGYTFTGWTDAGGNAVTTITGTALEGDLELTANFEVITYTITYNNLKKDTSEPAIKSFTVEDNVTLEVLTRASYYLSKWTVGAESGGEEITGWKAGEKTESINVYANWSSAGASVQIGSEGTVVGYKDLPAAATAATAAAATTEDPVTIKLLKNVTITARLDLGKVTTANYVLDLNGKTITENTYTNYGLAIYNGSLAITGAGTIDDQKTAGHSIVCQRAGATLTVVSGTFKGLTAITANASTKEGQEGAGAVLSGGIYNIDPTTDDSVTIADKYYVAADSEKTAYYVGAVGATGISGVISDKLTLRVLAFGSAGAEMKYQLGEEGDELTAIGYEYAGGVNGNIAFDIIVDITNIADTFYVNEVCGEVTEMTLGLSVLEYYKSLYTAGQTDAIVKLLAETINYAEKLQNYAAAAGYTVTWTDLDETNIPSWVADNLSSAASTSSVYELVKAGTATDKIASASLFIREQIRLGTVVNTGSAATISLYDGETEIETLDIPAAITAGRYVFTTAITPDNYDTTYTIILKDGDGAELCKVTYSVNSYCTRKSGVTDQGLDGLVAAIYNFGAAFENAK